MHRLQQTQRENDRGAGNAPSSVAEDGRPLYSPAGAGSFPASLLDGVASLTEAPAEDARVSPYLSAATALAFNRLNSAGYHAPPDVQKNLDTYLERMLRENVAPSFYSEGMVSSVRAVALQALAERDRLSLADLQR